MSQVLLQDIYVYPIKSNGGIRLSSSWVDSIGLPFDRRFVVTDPQGQFITARTHPKLCLVQCNLTETGLILTAPDMPMLKIEYAQCLDRYQPVTVWKDTINAQSCPAHVDAWFSQYLALPCQLVFFGEHSNRHVDKTTHPLAFADGYPLLLIAQASLNDLNTRLSHPVSMSQFRPNLVVEHCEPFAEDTWRHIRIGEVEFEITKACSRCVFTTVDPATGEKHPQLEPLATLKRYRQVEKGDVMFGQNLIPLNKGQVKVGDTVTVLKKGAPLVFLPAKATPIKNQTSTSKKNNALTLHCHKIIDETHDVKTFVLKNNDGHQLPYLAGQHLPITFALNGVQTKAVYTLSSSPTRPAHLSITVKRVAGGKVSNYLHDHFTVGDSVIGDLPAGKFHLGAINHAKVLLLSAGSGVTPMLSMLKAMVDQAINNDVIFLHSAKTAQDIIALEEVNALAKQHGNCTVIYTLTQASPPSWQGYQGHLNEEMLAQLPHLTEREVMVCGPEGFRKSAKTMLLALGLPEHQFHFESFGIRAAGQHPEHVPAPEQAKSSKANILFDSWDKYVEGNTADTVLEQAEAAGLIMPYSCRGGMCGSCKVKLESGEVKTLADDGLMDDEKAQGYILACSCIPMTDLVISKA